MPHLLCTLTCSHTRTRSSFALHGNSLVRGSPALCFLLRCPYPYFSLEGFRLSQVLGSAQDPAL